MSELAWATGGILLAVSPLVAILTRHQRWMAEAAFRRFDPGKIEREVELLRLQVKELRDIQYHQTIAIEGALRALRIPPEEAGQRERP